MRGEEEAGFGLGGGKLGKGENETDKLEKGNGEF